MKCHKVLWIMWAFGYNQCDIPNQENQMSISIDQDYCLEALTNLVRINSINPELVPEGPGEVRIAEYIADNCNPTDGNSS